MFTLTALKARGWSRKLIEELLGAHDGTAVNPVYRSKAPVKLWEATRVQVAEEHERFIAHQLRRENLSARSKAVAERKRKAQIDKVLEVEINVQRWPLPKLYKAALAEWIEMGWERGDYERSGTTPDQLPEETRDRFAINFARHNLCSSDKDIGLYKGEIGVNDAKVELECRIYGEIADVYPELATAAHRQAERLWRVISTDVSYIDLPKLSNVVDEEMSDDGMSDVKIEEIKKYRLHKRIERRSTALVKSIHGTKCQCCNFDYRLVYGGLGDGYIEVHHLRPLASLAEGARITFDAKKDFAVLCASCHRMIHRMDDPSDIVGLRQLMQGIACESAVQSR